MNLRAGLYLRFTCSNQLIGPIKRVGKDENGKDVIDVVVDDFAQFVHFGAGGDDTTLTRIEGMARVTLCDLQYRDKKDGALELLSMPPGGCYRCSELAWLEEPPSLIIGERCSPDAHRVEARTIMLRAPLGSDHYAQLLIYSTGVVRVHISGGATFKTELNSEALASLGESLLQYAKRLGRCL